MRKISEELLLEISKTLTRTADAINNLERLNSNKIIYPELKRDVHNLAEKLEDQYGLREYSNIEARDEMLEKEKKDSGQ